MRRINPILSVAFMLGLDAFRASLKPQRVTFGDQGEFTACQEEDGGGGWYLVGGLNMGGRTTYKTRAAAFEAAADVARARGDSVEECGKLRAGVLW